MATRATRPAFHLEAEGKEDGSHSGSVEQASV